MCAPEGRTDDPKLATLAAAVDKTRESAESGSDEETAKVTARLATAALEEFAATLEPKGSLAADYAAEAAFLRAESLTNQVLAIDLSKATTTAKLKNAIQWVATLGRAAEASYAEVAEFERIRWTFAARYRQAYLAELTANKIREAPLPPEVDTNEELRLMYLGQIDQALLPYEDKAVAGYKALISDAKAQRVETGWASKAARRLFVLRPNYDPTESK